MRNVLTLEIDAKANLGESPQWDSTNNRLYWVDITGKKVHIYDPDQKENKTIIFDQLVSSVNLRKNGGLVLTMLDGIYSYDIENDQLEFIVDPEKNITNNRLNDAKCDPMGRLWVGTMNLAGEKDKGSLYCLDEKLIIKKHFSPVQLSNGISWSPDHTKMYYVDSPTKKVLMFDYNVEKGTISHPQEIIRISYDDGVPDGITTDIEDNLWIAHWGGSKVTRWNPDKGELVEVIDIPVTNVTSCMFGGKKMNELFITTARDGLSKAALDKEPQAGGVFKLTTNTRGMVTYKFSG